MAIDDRLAPSRDAARLSLPDSESLGGLLPRALAEAVRLGVVQGLADPVTI